MWWSFSVMALFGTASCPLDSKVNCLRGVGEMRTMRVRLDRAAVT